MIEVYVLFQAKQKEKGFLSGEDKLQEYRVQNGQAISAVLLCRRVSQLITVISETGSSTRFGESKAEI